MKTGTKTGTKAGTRTRRPAPERATEPAAGKASARTSGTGRETSTANRETSTTGRRISTAGRGISTAGRRVLIAGRSVLIAGRSVLAAGRSVLAAGRSVLAAGRSVLAAGRPVLAAGRRVGSRLCAGLRRPVAVGAVAAVLAGASVLVATALVDDEYRGRVSLVANPVPAATATTTTAQYGEVVALALPALVELARSPSVLRTAAEQTGLATDELADGVAVELVPASGLARVSVRATSAERSGAAATAIARAMIEADLLAPAGALRLLDQRPDVTRVAPDRPLGAGLALAAAALAGVSAGTLRHLRRAPAEAAVRAALGHPVATLRADEPGLPDRLALLCGAAGRAPRVVAVRPDLVRRAEELTEVLARRLPTVEGSAADGAEADGVQADTAVVAVAPRGRRQDELAAVAGVLPSSAVLVAVVLA